VNQFGQVQLADIERKVKPHTRLISCMWVHNELGSLNPIEQVGNFCRGKNIYFHTDATQAIGKIRFKLSALPIDALSLSAHKIYGPKGAGALFLRSKDSGLRIQPLLYGGGHEKGQRSGTLAVPNIVGLGQACEILSQDFDLESQKNFENGNFLLSEIRKNFPQAVLNGHPDQKVPTTWNFTFKGAQVPTLISGLAVSRRSACQTGDTGLSPTMAAIGIAPQDSTKTFRFSIGRNTSRSDIEALISKLLVVIK